jgi:protein SCO1
VVEQAMALLAEPVADPVSKGTSKALPFSGVLAAILVAILPKCPVCWAAYLSAFGLTAFAGNAFRGLHWLVIGLLTVNLISVFWRARFTQQWLGFGFSIAGTFAIALNLCSDMNIPAPLGIVFLTTGSLVSSLGHPFGLWFARLAASFKRRSI